MSAMGDLRARRNKLNKIHEMLPLSERETILATWVLYGDNECDMAKDIESEPVWWGPKAVEVAKTLAG